MTSVQSGAQIFNPLDIQPQCILDAINRLTAEGVDRASASNL